MPKADLILISHGHGDHSSASTVDAVRAVGGVVLAPMAVYNNLSASAKAATTVLFNGGKTNVFGIEIEAISTSSNVKLARTLALRCG